MTVDLTAAPSRRLAVYHSPAADGADPEPTLDSIVAELVQEFSGRLDEAGIADCVRSIREEFAAARITQYLPILVHREAKARLHHLSG